MNSISSYKKHLKNNSSEKKMSIQKTIRVKDIDKFTPIPTAIKIKAPEPLKSRDDCHIVDYPLENILINDFKNISSPISKIVICPYFITTCRNRYGITKPFLQYLLYKYPSDDKNIGNLLVFPFVNIKYKKNILKESDKLLKKIINIKLKTDGYLINNNVVYVFYNLSTVDDYTNKPRAEQQWLKLLKNKNNLWWVLMDEICNHKKTLNFSIHKSVTNLFYNNPILIYLLNKNKKIEIPVVAYYGNYYKFLPIVATLGQKPRSWHLSNFGPYYYFTNYNGAFRNAAWTSNYQQRKVYGKEISDKNGKIIKGGIVRFALFLNNTKALLHQVEENNKWAKNFDSLYLGRLPRMNDSVWKINPMFTVKKYDQQIPLSMHIIDKNSLKATWDPLYDKYQIE